MYSLNAVSNYSYLISPFIQISSNPISIASLISNPHATTKEQFLSEVNSSGYRVSLLTRTFKLGKNVSSLNLKCLIMYN